MNFKDKVKKLRRERRISQARLASIIDVSQSAVAKWEIGMTEPTLSAIIKIAKYFKVSSDYLIGLSETFE